MSPRMYVLSFTGGGGYETIAVSDREDALIALVKGHRLLGDNLATDDYWECLPGAKLELPMLHGRFHIDLVEFVTEADHGERDASPGSPRRVRHDSKWDPDMPVVAWRRQIFTDDYGWVATNHGDLRRGEGFIYGSAIPDSPPDSDSDSDDLEWRMGRRGV